MSKNKDHKVLVGQSRPTENKALNTISSDITRVWITKIDIASRTDGVGVRVGIDAVTKVIIDLIKEIKAGNVSRDVISELVKQRQVGASLVQAQLFMRVNNNV